VIWTICDYPFIVGMPSADDSPPTMDGGTTSDDYTLLLKPFQLDWDSGNTAFHPIQT